MQKRHLEKKEQRAKELEEKELENVTFKPKLDTKSSNSKSDKSSVTTSRYLKKKSVSSY
jgi:hypothetical protein